MCEILFGVQAELIKPQEIYFKYSYVCLQEQSNSSAEA